MTIKLEVETTTHNYFQEGEPTRDQAIALFESSAFINAVSESFTQSDRTQFKELCTSSPGDDPELASLWEEASFRWHGITCDKWDLSKFKTCYTYEFKTYWFDKIVFTTSGHRFVVAGDRVLSFAEFNHFHGISVSDHIKEYAEYVTGLSELLVVAVKEPLVIREMTMLENNKVVTKQMIGPPSVPTQRWCYNTLQCVDPGELIATVPLHYKESEC